MIEIPVERITDWASFHEVFAQVLHLADHNGKNGNTFIDCLRDIAKYDTNPELRSGVVVLEPMQAFPGLTD